MKFALLLLAVVLSAQTGKLPSFDEYKVSEVFTGKPAEPRLSLPFAREFRTQIREAAKKGPNFAGKFTIAQWGCGGGCIQMAVINEETGAVSRGPFMSLDFSAALHFADGSDTSMPDSFEPLVFLKDSRLLAVRGCPEEDRNNCALFYHAWDGAKFAPVQKLKPTAMR
ncbi:MAG TPA: hypothetical protein VLW25_05120 [Bryobacteraceae bacterium]|nr:hypothetical protein [Bryobacteraceae bacterium]